MRKHWIYINDEINSSTNSLKYAMELMDINDHDMSRYILTKANTNFCHINNGDDFFDLDSSVGDWLNVFRDLTSVTIEKTIQCAKCNKNRKNDIIMNCISVQVIDSNIIQEIKKNKIVNKYENVEM